MRERHLFCRTRQCSALLDGTDETVEKHLSQNGYRLAASNFVTLVRTCGMHVSFKWRCDGSYRLETYFSQNVSRLAASTFVILVELCGMHVSPNADTMNLIDNDKDRNDDNPEDDIDNDDDDDNDDNARAALSRNSLDESRSGQCYIWRRVDVEQGRCMMTFGALTS